MNLINPTIFSSHSASHASKIVQGPGQAAEARCLHDQAHLSAEFFEHQTHSAEVITRIFQNGFVPPRSLGWAVARSLTALTWRWMESAFPGCSEQSADAEASLYLALSELAPDSFSHSNRVCQLSSDFARELGANQEELDLLRKGASFKECGVVALQLAAWTEGEREEAASLLRAAGAYHDIGKLAISNDILNKPAPLTADERALMALHPLIGEAMLENIPSAQAILPAVRHHHEHWDGCGYVDGLQGERIPLLGRIIAITDAYDAMTEGRSYRTARTPELACAELLAGAGSQFDPELVQKFARMVLA